MRFRFGKFMKPSPAEISTKRKLFVNLERHKHKLLWGVESIRGLSWKLYWGRRKQGIRGGGGGGGTSERKLICMITRTINVQWKCNWR